MSEKIHMRLHLEDLAEKWVEDLKANARKGPREGTEVWVEGQKCVRIELTRGQTALVSFEDYPTISGFRWYARKCRHTWYAYWNTHQKGKTIFCLMHNLILRCDPGFTVDHKNGNGLDNRRLNLRQATESLQGANKLKRLGTSSKFKGVSWHKCTGFWQAQITLHRKARFLGLYSNQEDAAKAYDSAAVQLFGEFSKLNFPL